MGGTWTPEELDRYLEDAAAFAPGSTKTIRIPNSEERREIIDFLRTLE
jgi:cytochrome c2